ncbi:MAG: LPS export ABC transporter periplasmic protein LptC [Alphaproteobacteria bacterium]|nr:LPS export ABC transporter periplasmic protein LptC [Alphaproteobacteria bacterium]
MARATSFDPVPSAASAKRNDRLVVVGVDRSHQFGKARRHTFLVKSLRRVLPLLTLASLGIYGASALTSADFGTSVGLQVISRILPENLTMNNPYYEGFTDDGGSYIVRAKTAQQDLQKPDRIKLNAITGVMTDAKKSKTNLTADHGIFDSKRSILNLDGGIDVVSEDGLVAKLKSAILQTRRGIIISKEPVQVNMPGGQVNSDLLRIQQKEKIITFNQNVRTRLTPEKPKPDGGEAAAPAAAPQQSRTAMLGSSDGPVDIDSTRLTVDRGNGMATFVGNVKAVQADQTLQTHVLNVKFQEAAEAGSDAGKSAAASALPDASRIELITAPGAVIMTRGELEQMTGQSAVFDTKNETAVIKGSVVMSSGPDRKALAELAEIDSKSDTIVLTGSVVVSQGDNELRGERLFVDRAKGTSQMTSAKDASGNGGRIFAKLKRQVDVPAGAQTTLDKATETEAAKPDGTADSPVSMTAFKGDPKAPIDIEADRLDVDDSKKEAVFSGKVLVEQGPMSLSTVKLIAYYSGEANLVGTEPAPATSTTTPGTPGSGTELTRIEAKGEVFVNSKVAGQNARGDWADIDMKANTVLLGGDVVLNQGKNVVRASRLKIDLTTGNALVESSPEETAGTGWATTAIPNMETSVKKGAKRGKKGKDATDPPALIIRGNRPSAVFYPTQVGGAKKPDGQALSPAPVQPSPQASTQRPAAASSWEATTDTDVR